MLTADRPAADGGLDSRYGRARQRGVDRRLGLTLAALGVIGGLVVVLFGGWQSQGSIEYRDLAYAVEGPTSVRVDFEVTAPPERAIVCTVEALSTSYATVGWRVLELPPVAERTQRLSVSLVTTSPATTGTVRSCLLREEES